MQHYDWLPSFPTQQSACPTTPHGCPTPPTLRAINTKAVARKKHVQYPHPLCRGALTHVVVPDVVPVIHEKNGVTEAHHFTVLAPVLGVNGLGCNAMPSAMQCKAMRETTGSSRRETKALLAYGNNVKMQVRLAGSERPKADTRERQTPTRRRSRPLCLSDTNTQTSVTLYIQRPTRLANQNTALITDSNNPNTATTTTTTTHRIHHHISH